MPRRATSQNTITGADLTAAIVAPAAFQLRLPLRALGFVDITSITIPEVGRAALMLTLVEVGRMPPGWSQPWEAPCLHATRRRIAVAARVMPVTRAVRPARACGQVRKRGRAARLSFRTSPPTSGCRAPMFGRGAAAPGRCTAASWSVGRPSRRRAHPPGLVFAPPAALPAVVRTLVRE